MPSVFTIEGLTAAQIAQLGNARAQVPVVRYPPYGSPLAPHGAYNVGSTRPPTLVFNPAHLVVDPPRVRLPDRGPITDYGQQYAPLLMMRPYVNLSGPEDTEFAERRNNVIAIASAVGLAVAGWYVGASIGKRRARI